MCGIAGILDLRQRATVPHETLRLMTDALSHRGPDDEGSYVDRYVGLAHRRLAVIDPSPAGHQPMVASDGKTAVVFNGTIYNFLELRSLLQAEGHRFVSRSDTEVLVHGWEQWGEGLVEKLNGHFSFAVWDARIRKLFLVRDRFGTRPLYWANLNGLWLFASEIKAILAHPAYSPDINYEALYEYFTFQNVFRAHTIFRDVNLVSPANIMTIDAENGRHQRRSYWDYDFGQADSKLKPEEAAEHTRELLSQAVRRQLVADVPVGAYLSGGMDSGSIVAMASQVLQRMHTFTCGWHMDNVEGAEANFDERAQAEQLSYLFSTEHYEQVVGHNDVSWALPKVVYHLEDLRLGMSYGQFYIARLASKFVKVCLAGTGGDELFGGYPWRYFRVSRSLGKQEFFDNYYEYWQRLVPDSLRHDLFQPHFLDRVQDRDMRRVLTRVFTFQPRHSFASSEDHIANSLYFEAKTFLHGLLLVSDKLAMAHGLEERLPFLDNDLVEFAQKIPVGLKLRNLDKWQRKDENLIAKKKSYYTEFNDGKNILRQAMRGILPASVTDCRKQGFSSPDESWYRGANMLYAVKTLLNRRALCHDLINPVAIQSILEEHWRGETNHRLLIWSLLCFEFWLRIFLDGGAASLQPSRSEESSLDRLQLPMAWMAEQGMSPAMGTGGV